MKNRFFAPIALGAALMVWSCQDAASPDMTQDELTPLMSMSGGPVGGPLFLSGDDADDGGHCQGTACGGLYATAMKFVHDNSTSGGTGVAVIGANFGNALSAFNSWNLPGNGGPGASVTFLNTTSAIANANFATFRMIYIASVSNHTSGGITTTQLAALNARQASIVNFVNVLGGGVMALTEANVSIQYGWLPLSLTTGDKAHFGPDILPTPAMATISPVTSAQLNHGCCYHTLYVGPPGFSGLQVLAFHDDNGNGVFDGQGSSDEVLILGGANVTIQGNISLSPATSTNPTGTNHTVTAFAQDGSPLAPAVSVTVTFTVTLGPNATTTGTATTDGSGNASFTYTGSGGAGSDNIVATFLDGAGNLQTSNTVQKTWEVVNVPPMANAGPDQLFEQSLSAIVTLNGTASTDDNGIVTFEWSDDLDVVIPNGPTPTATFGIGIHTVTLTVTAGDGATDTDEVVITVDNTCPAEADCNITLNEPDGTPVAGIDVEPDTFDEPVTITASFADDCHEFLLHQEGRCLDLNVFDENGDALSPDAFGQSVTVGLCYPNGITDASDLSLYRFDEKNGKVQVLQETKASFVRCLDFTGSALPANPFMRFARGVLEGAKDFFLPQQLMARRGDGGFGGLSPFFSFFVWARTMPISDTKLYLNAPRSGKDWYTISGTFDLDGLGFDPTLDIVKVQFGDTDVETIPVDSFKGKGKSGKFTYTMPSNGSGISHMVIESDGSFSITTKNMDLADLDQNFIPFCLQIGDGVRGRTQGVGLEYEGKSFGTNQGNATH